jgi:hypothetical protein
METVSDMMSELEGLIGEKLDWDVDQISSKHVVINSTDLGHILEAFHSERQLKLFLARQISELLCEVEYEREYRDGYTSFRPAPMKGGE